MAKTRSQTRNITIKKEEEEEEEDCKRILNLGNASNTRNKITKRQPSKRNNRHLPVQQVKVEEDTDTKALLKSTSKSPKLPKAQPVSQEQINQLIDYVVNHGMSVTEAARKANMSQTTAHYYYTDYKNDPDKKIPSPRNQCAHYKRFLTQEQVKNLIRYIVDDKMSIPKASAKANLACYTSRYYYKKYLEDPDHAIPVLCSRQSCTQDQKNELIGYIVNDKMNIKAASRKAKMSIGTARRYYHEYFEEQHPDIPTPSHIAHHKRHTQEQKKEVIDYIIGDKMTVVAASKKANMSPGAAGRYYRQYLKDKNMELPARKHYTQDEINKFIGYIVDDKMSITAASKKANVSYTTAHGYFQRYLNEHNLVMSTMKYGKNKISEFIGYIVEDKMTFRAASKKANMDCITGRKYYRQYLKDRNLPTPVLKRITQDEINRLIGYIVDDKMSVLAASKKVNIGATTGYTHYHRYLNDQKSDAPTRHRPLDSAPKNK